MKEKVPKEEIGDNTNGKNPLDSKNNNLSSPRSDSGVNIEKAFMNKLAAHVTTDTRLQVADPKE